MKVGSDEMNNLHSRKMLRAAIRIVEDMRIDNLFTMSEIERQAYSTAVAVMGHAIVLIKERPQVYKGQAPSNNEADTDRQEEE